MVGGVGGGGGGGGGGGHTCWEDFILSGWINGTIAKLYTNNNTAQLCALQMKDTIVWTVCE